MFICLCFTLQKLREKLFVLTRSICALSHLETDQLDGLLAFNLMHLLHVFIRVHLPLIWLSCTVRLKVMWSSRVDFIKPEWVTQVRQPCTHLFFLYLSICLTIFLSLSNDDWFVSLFFLLCCSNVLHVLMSSSDCPLCHSPPNKGASFAWAPEHTLVIDLSQD